MAKVITLGMDRSEAIERMRSALERFVITGIDTTIPFLRDIFDQPDYIKGQVHTRWIEEFLDSLPSSEGEEEGPPFQEAR
jgi:acetyl-CoA carboxylase biotin carboxylase subunit